MNKTGNKSKTASYAMLLNDKVYNVLSSEWDENLKPIQLVNSSCIKGGNIKDKNWYNKILSLIISKVKYFLINGLITDKKIISQIKTLI